MFSVSLSNIMITLTYILSYKERFPEKKVELYIGSSSLAETITQCKRLQNTSTAGS